MSHSTIAEEQALFEGDFFAGPRVLYEELDRMGVAWADVVELVMPGMTATIRRLNVAIPKQDTDRALARAVAAAALEIVRRAGGAAGSPEASVEIHRLLREVPDLTTADLAWGLSAAVTLANRTVDDVAHAMPERAGEHFLIAAAVLVAAWRTLEHAQVLNRVFGAGRAS